MLSEETFPINIFKSLITFFCFDDYRTVILNIKTREKKYGYFINQYQNIYGNKSLLMKELFNTFFKMFVESSNGQFYHCLWTLIHSIPLHMSPNNKFVHYFYKSFVISKLNCILCRTHYTQFIKSLEQSVFDDQNELFDKTIKLHDEVSNKINKTNIISDTKKWREEYCNILKPQYHSLTTLSIT
jgi:hypothetical protein